MPRGKRKTSLQKVEEQLANIDSEIKIHKNKISELQTQEKSLREQKRNCNWKSSTIQFRAVENLWMKF